MSDSKIIIAQIFNYQKELCKIWIEFFTQKTQTYLSRNSYVCKHTVERLWGTYIPREAFENAAKELNYLGKPSEFGSINLKYKFTEKCNSDYWGFDLKKVITIIDKINELNSKLNRNQN